MLAMIRSIPLIIFILVSGPGFGQPEPPPALDALISETLERNLALQAADHRWTASKHRRPQVTTLDDPIFSYTRWLSSPETRVGPQTNVLMLSQRIPYPGKRGLRGDMADQKAVAFEAQRRSTERDIVFQVKQTYYDLYRVDQSIRVLTDYLAVLRTFTRVAEEKYATGTGSQASVLKSQVERSRILERQLVIERTRPGLVAGINALRNRAMFTPIGRIAAIDSSRYTTPESLIVKQALLARQELQEIEARIRQSELMTSLARLAFRPDFNLQASYITVPKQSSLISDAGKDAFSIMVGLNIPIMRGKRRAAVEEAKVTRMGHEMTRDHLRNTIRAEITEVYMKIQQTAILLDLYEQGMLLQAESSLSSALAAYQTGNLDFLNLLDAERMLLQIRLGYITEQANYRRQVTTLEWAAGGRLPEDMK